MRVKNAKVENSLMFCPMGIIPKPVCASRSATAQTLAQLITVRAQRLHNDRQKSADRVK